MKKFLIAVILISCLLFAGCSSPSRYEENFFAMNTAVTFIVYEKYDGFSALCSNLLYSVENELGTNGIISPDGDDNGAVVSDGAVSIIEKAEYISALTDGLYDVTIAPLSLLWNVVNATEPPSDEEISEALSYVDYKKITVDGNTVYFENSDMSIDLGSAGKGLAGDVIAEKMIENGIENGIINLGGNIHVFGNNPNREDGIFVVGIKNPFDTSSVIATVKAKNTNVITSGVYERYFEYNGKKYIHILNPKTGYPSESGLLSTTVICTDGTVADIMSTALFLCGKDEGIKLLETVSEKYPDIAAVFVSEDGSIDTYNAEQYGFTEIK